MTIKRPATGWKLQRVTTHPGEMLREEFLLPLGITQNALAMKIRVPATRIGDIVHGRRAVTPDTALRLAQFFGNSPEFWLNLQPVSYTHLGPRGRRLGAGNCNGLAVSPEGRVQ